jgi:hypothetical protein
LETSIRMSLSDSGLFMAVDSFYDQPYLGTHSC